MRPRETSIAAMIGMGFAALCAPGHAQDDRHAPSEKDIALYAKDDLSAKARRYAVVVGIGSYKNSSVSPLEYAVKDAKDVAEELTAAGWKVSLMTSALTDAQLRPDTATDIVNRIGDYAKATKEGDTLLFFYSGHGFLGQDKNGYLCPITVDPQSPEQLARSGLSIASIRAALASGKAKQQILILDACRNEPQGKSLFGAGFSEESLLASEGLGILYATAPGKRSFEPMAGEKDDLGNPIENGLFTHFLLRGIRGEARLNADEFVTFHELSYWVGDAMTGFVLEDRATKYSEQKPWKDWIGGMSDDVLIRWIGPAPSPALAGSNGDDPRKRPPTLLSCTPPASSKLTAGSAVDVVLSFDAVLESLTADGTKLAIDASGRVGRGRLVVPAQSPWRLAWSATTAKGAPANGVVEFAIGPSIEESTTRRFVPGQLWSGSLSQDGKSADWDIVFTVTKASDGDFEGTWMGRSGSATSQLFIKGTLIPGSSDMARFSCTFYSDKNHRKAYSTASGTVTAYKFSGEWKAVGQSYGGTFTLAP